MKIEIDTKNIASFNIKEIKHKYENISISDFNKLLEIIPAQIKEKEDYLNIICEWFLQDVAIPVIQHYITEFVKTLSKKYNINAFVPFYEFKHLIDNNIRSQ